ncbi:MAG: surface-adhesin E family protein [Burkholderiales bacterium]
MLILLLSVLPVQAADWLDIGARGPDRMFYDRSKLQFANDAVTYWRRVEFRMPLPIEKGMAYSALYRERIDCRARTLATLGFLFYSDDNRVLQNVYIPSARAVPIVPESAAEQFSDALCPEVAAQKDKAKQQEDPKAVDLRKLEDELRTLEESIRRLRETGKPMPQANPKPQ